MIGQTFDVYKILEKRGEGGMGVLYKAHDERLDRIVALKTLHADLVSDPEFREKLGREAKSLARLNHLNIVTVYQYLIFEGHHFIVMEYVEGRTVSEIIGDWGPYPFADAAKIVLQILDAIGYAHKQGVVHRDIKPSNILINTEDVVKVTDFGIAKLLDAQQKTRTGQGAGSLFYMAPEQIQHGDVDGRTDIYALGVTFFEMLTGTVPFTAESEFLVMKKHIEEEPPAPSTFNPAVSKVQDELILHAMKKKPGERFASAEEFAVTLRDVLSFADTDPGITPSKKRPVPERKVPGAKKPPKKDKVKRQDIRKDDGGKKSKAVWVYAAVIILAIVAAATMFWPSSEPEPPPISTTERDTTEVEFAAPPETARETTMIAQHEDQTKPLPTTALSIDVDPFNQRSKVTGVWIDGKRVTGSVPFDYKGLSRGLHWVTIETANGSLTDTVTWTGDDRRLSFFLSSAVGRLSVKADFPPGTFPEGEGFADIYIDGQDIARGTPYEIRDLLVGPHKIEVKKDGYRAREGPQIVRIEPTGRNTIGFRMQPR